MQLDYIENINAYGNHVVRLYGFDKSQAIKFRQLITDILANKNELNLSSVNFIEARNCNLVLRIADTDEGITTTDKKQFFCDLTIAGYEQMVMLLAPFCSKETKGYQWLYEIDNPIDFLFSPAGTW